MIKEISFNLCTAFGAHRLFRRMRKDQILIVMYHGIVDEALPFPCWWQLPYENFYWQIKYLKKNYAVMPLREIFAKLQRGERLPDNAAAITFDDGFENNYTLGYPLLKALEVPATIYVVTDFIGTEKLLWLDELFMLFLETAQESVDLSQFGLRVFWLKTVKSKQWSFFQICEHLKGVAPTDKNKILDHLRINLGAKRDPTMYGAHFKLLSWEEVDQMKQSGLIDFGAHSCTHEILSQLDDQTLQREIKHSCERIGRTGPSLFAYPNGRKQDFDDRAKNILTSSKALCAVSTISGLNHPDHDPLELKRISIGEDTTPSRFKLLCSGFIDEIKTLNTYGH
jgi:peptidoglycan/xylan/chitin deacetylase (PgdA/CDA1 family)